MHKKSENVAQLNVSPTSILDILGSRRVSAYGFMLTASYLAQINQQGIPETNITGDESWMHHITPGTEMDSMIWKCRDSLPIQKFKTFHSVCKITAMVFWDAEGVLLVDFLPRGETINVAHYCNMLDKERLFQPTGQHVMSSIFSDNVKSSQMIIQ